MSGLELMMTILFVVPMALACLVFVLCVIWMQVKEEQRQQQLVHSAPMRRRARRAVYHAV